MAAEARPHRTPPSSGDIVMLDLRGEESDWRELAEGLHADERPMMIISERPRRLVKALSGRPGGTMLLTGAESDAGYKVALAVCSALRVNALARAATRPRRGGGAEAFPPTPTVHWKRAGGSGSKPISAAAIGSRRT